MLIVEMRMSCTVCLKSSCLLICFHSWSLDLSQTLIQTIQILKEEKTAPKPWKNQQKNKHPKKTKKFRAMSWPADIGPLIAQDVRGPARVEVSSSHHILIVVHIQCKAKTILLTSQCLFLFFTRAAGSRARGSSGQHFIVFIFLHSVWHLCLANLFRYLFWQSNKYFQIYSGIKLT